MDWTRTTALSVLLAGALTAQAPVCTTVIDGIGCGPQLDVTFAPVGSAGNNTIMVDVSGLNPAGIGLMAWGNTAINFPLATGCNAYTDFLWGHLINPDSSGSWAWSRSWPASVLGMYRIQVAGLAQDSQGNLEITMTDCVVASCQ
ncbi:MAG: hypothetical protein ACJA0V_002836 [Planctomycetota bacterium]|jgi:hypothetical protein